VDYLILGDRPHLVAFECRQCGARYFDHRNGCAACPGTEFDCVDLDTEGEIVSFTIVHQAAPGVTVPYVAAVIDCAGTRVRGNIVNTPADPEHVTLGIKVRLTTYPVATDSTGTHAVGFGFEPVEGANG
jgi:uncharacterized OB-fold protein